MEKYYALINDYRNEKIGLSETKILYISKNIEMLKQQMNDEFQSSLEAYYDEINIENCEEYIGELECSLSLMYEWDVFHNEYRIIEVENGLI